MLGDFLSYLCLVLNLAPQRNNITLLELQHALMITFTDTPYINKTTHGVQDDTT